MSEIGTLIQHYRGGRLTLDELAGRLAARTYAVPSLYQSPPPDTRMDEDEWSREHQGSFPEEGTWQEVEAARLDGLLTRDEYWFVHDRVVGGEG
jgi:hypothetical protein